VPLGIPISDARGRRVAGCAIAAIANNAIPIPYRIVPPGTLVLAVLPYSHQEISMNWDQIEGKWKQMKGSVKQRWGKITDDDLDYIAGSRDRFVGRLQERYGMAREDAQKQADEWLKNHPVIETTTTSTTTRRSGGSA
jgi:uncharacterized protein YjbJ (UPF0337 family)